VCLKAPFPEGAFYVVEGADDDKSGQLGSGRRLRRGIGLALPTGALEMFGKRMTVDEVLDEVEKDASIYRSTRAG